MRMCSCGFTEFQVEVDDNVVKICCVQCDTVYFPDEVADLPDTDDDK